MTSPLDLDLDEATIARLQLALTVGLRILVIRDGVALSEQQIDERARTMTLTVLDALGPQLRLATRRADTSDEPLFDGTRR